MTHEAGSAYRSAGYAHLGGFVPRDAPFKFEAGTPAIEATIGFGAAVKWMRAIGMDKIREHFWTVFGEVF